MRFFCHVNGAATYRPYFFILYCRAASSTEGEKLVPFLIANGAMVDAKDNSGRTPLHIHCARGRIYAVACLVYHGADTNCQTSDTKQTPLQVAASHGHDEIQRILLAYGATPPEGG